MKTFRLEDFEILVVLKTAKSKVVIFLLIIAFSFAQRRKSVMKLHVGCGQRWLNGEYRQGRLMYGERARRKS